MVRGFYGILERDCHLRSKSLADLGEDHPASKAVFPILLIFITAFRTFHNSLRDFAV